MNPLQGIYIPIIGGAKVMSLFTLITNLYHALYAGKITKIYGRRLQKKKTARGDVYYVNLPISWIRSLEELPKEIIMLETEHGDLVILNSFFPM